MPLDSGLRVGCLDSYACYGVYVADYRLPDERYAVFYDIFEVD
jgi:hypothetical protein